MRILSFFLLACSLLLAVSCKKDPCDDPNSADCPGNAQEVLTTVRITFMKGGVSKAFAWRDADGPGGNSATIDTIRLDTNALYTAMLEVLDESKSPADNITAEIFNERDKHQFFFGGTAVQSQVLTIAYQDADTKGKPIGLTNQATTRMGGTGTLTVRLIHEPNKEGAGVATGDPANAGGETDILVEIPVVVQ